LPSLRTALRPRLLGALLALVPLSAQAAEDVPMPVTGDTTRGAAAAPVTIVAFLDYQCPFCARLDKTLDALDERYPGSLRISVLNNPLAFHKDAGPAAQAALSAASQGRFWELHRKLFANTKALSRADLERYAVEVGLDVQRFRTDLDGRVYEKRITREQALGQKYGARGTPHCFVNGRPIRGAQPEAKFAEVIDDELKQVATLVAAGKAPADVYAARLAANLKEGGPPPARGRARPEPPPRLKVPVGDSVSIGPKDALVTIVSFQDFQCPFCERGAATMKRVLEHYPKRVRLVFKHNPLGFHNRALPAALAAEAARAQGRFWELHDKLFANRTALERSDLTRYATEVGLNVGQFEADLDTAAYKPQIEADQALAAKLGARGTPTFFVNGWSVRGAQPYEAFKAKVDEAIVEAEGLVTGGVARGQVYEAVIRTLPEEAPKVAPRRPTPKEPEGPQDVKVAPNDPARGPANAPVTLVAFLDFQCPFCARVAPTVDQLGRIYGDKLRVVVKQNPLPFHKRGDAAAAAALAAHEQGRFWEMYSRLLANQRKLEEADLVEHARKIGLDVARFEKARASSEISARVEADMAQAASLGARGTPSFFVNGFKLVGAQPLDRFKALIDEQLAK